MDIFDYEPIDLERPAIRLLQLLRGKGPAIECMLYQAYFDGTDTIPYDALSYNWGSTDGTSTMMVNGKTFSVAENLHSALQHLRSEDIDRVLWVDAICIDQANLRERGHAVSQLPLIYHTAQRTLCWTGAEHLTFLRKLTSTTLEVGDYQRAMVECLSEVDILHSMYRIAEHDLEVFGKEAEMFDSNTWHNLDAFLNQAYFNRIWVIQDIVCSRNPVIFGGEECIPWSELAQSLFAWLFFSPKSGPRSPATMFVLLCEAMRCRYLGLDNRHTKLPDLLLALRSAPGRCSDPRDYVYSAYSIATGTSPDEAPGSDYELGTESVYTQASQHLNILSGQPLSLSLTDDIHPRQPSWSTNWNTRTKRFLLNHPASSFSAYRRPNADQHSTEIVRPPDATESLRMRFSGFIVDAIRRTSDYLPPRRHCDHYDVNDNCLFFVNWYEFATDYSRRTEDSVLLDYADTIQARGCGHLWEDAVITSQDRIQKARAFLNFLSDEDADAFDVTNSIRLFHAACFPSHGRRFAITQKGRFCLVPKATQGGDLVCIPCNSRVPYIFRPRTEGDGYRNIGETFVNGIMHGEMSELKDWEKRDFLLY